jgi:hypothetical protein
MANLSLAVIFIIGKPTLGQLYQVKNKKAQKPKQANDQV